MPQAPRIAYSAALVCIALVGAFTAAARDAAERPDISLPQFADGSELAITARVLKDGVWRLDLRLIAGRLGRFVGKRISRLLVVGVVRGASEEFDFGGARIQVFAPAPDWELKTRVRDDDAMVLRVSYGQNSAYLPGDSGKKIEERLVPRLPHRDLLKVAHHGSSTSTSPELLEAIQPKYAVVSVGARNSSKHPRPEVLARLGAAHVATFRTDTVGAISFYMDGESIRAERVPRQ